MMMTVMTLRAIRISREKPHYSETSEGLEVTGIDSDVDDYYFSILSTV
jgi:hypothetical protein